MEALGELHAALQTLRAQRVQEPARQGVRKEVLATGGWGVTRHWLSLASGIGVVSVQRDGCLFLSYPKHILLPNHLLTRSPVQSVAWRLVLFSLPAAGHTGSCPVP